MEQPIELSVIIPTHNRCELLLKNLAALRQQTYPMSQFEVIVVADACRDDTVTQVEALINQAPYQLRLFSHEAKSAAATRNMGAAQAQGDTLLFLDDDVLPHPKFISAHNAAQHQQSGIVLGYSKPVLPVNASQWQRDARRWWEDAFRVMAQPGHRFTYRDFFSGNVSLPASLFRQVGGFDTSFTGRLEDYELGIRLIEAGASFHYTPDAVGYHHDDTDLVKWLRRIRQEGIADIQTGQRHPELRTSIFGYFTEPPNRWLRWMRTLAFTYPDFGDKLERFLLGVAAQLERYRLRYRWQQLIWLLREYNYWRGVATIMGDRPALRAWLQEAEVPPAMTADAPQLDVTALLSGADLRNALTEGATKGLRLVVDGVEITSIPPQLGVEPLREAHLQHMLRTLPKDHFVPALALRLIRSKEGNLLC